VSPKKNDVEVAGSFTISAQDASLTEARVKRLLAQATAEATTRAKKDGYEVETRSGLDGGFFGVGETAAVLVLMAKSATVTKMLAAAAAAGKVVAAKTAEGGAIAAGGFFFNEYVAPRLRKLNLLPANFHAAQKKALEPKPEKKPAEPKSTRKANGHKRA
jgi:hypothetical protein